MDAIDAQASVLVLVDYQARLMPAIHDAAAVAARAVLLAQAAHTLGIPVIGTEQNPAGLGPNVEPVRAQCRLTLAKTRFDACADGLVQALHEAKPGCGQVVVAGCEAHVCLLQTVLQLIEDEFEVWVVTDACGSRTERNRDAAYDRLAAAGCELVSTEMVGFEWLGDAGHPRFRDWQGLIR